MYIKIAFCILFTQLGAFIRQTTYQGYMGARVEMRLPTKTLSEINISSSDATGYLYLGLQKYSDFDMEGGFQYSYAYDNYSAYIRINGASLIFDSDDSDTNDDPRFKSNSNVVYNLRYEPANNKVKFYANGTNINNVYQSLVFSYSKTFTTTERDSIRMRRVTGLAYTNTYTGTQSLGKIDVQYNNSTLLKSDNITTVNFASSLLDSTWTVNGKLMGTVDWPIEKVTKTPTTGDLLNQRHILNCN